MLKILQDLFSSSSLANLIEELNLLSPLQNQFWTQCLSVSSMFFQITVCKAEGYSEVFLVPPEIHRYYALKEVSLYLFLQEDIL